MSLWSIEEVCEALSVKFESQNYKLSDISIDTRTLKKGSLYIPIIGKKYDGHDFIEDAFKKGAEASLVEEKKVGLIKKFSKPILIVKNTKISLKRLAIFSRKRAKKLLMICITGSNGKTTLKEWLSQILSEKFLTFCNYGNLNNEIGMPLSLAKMPRETKICILELGMNKPGEILKLTKIANPNISIITNVGNAHIANFRSEREIAKEKSQILNFLNQRSFAVIPKDSKYFSMLNEKALKNTKNVFSFGYNKFANFKIIQDSKKKSKTSFLIQNKKVSFPKNTTNIWKINVSIILCVLKILKIDHLRIKKKIEHLKSIKGRGLVHEIKIKGKKITLIDESYNSNPMSLLIALKNLKKSEYKNKRKVCVIGDMLELGKNSIILHKNIASKIIESESKIVITLGKFSKVIAKMLPKSIESFHFANFENVYNKLVDIIVDDDIIMIKGSNSTKLYKVSEKLISKK